jgi:hypothetical protein
LDSYLDEDERCKLLKGERLVIGDIKADEDIGKMISGGDGELRALRRNAYVSD